MIHYQRHKCPPKVDYRRPPAGRLVVPWHLHPKASRAAALPSSVDLTPYRPSIYDQGQVGQCSACGTVGAIQTSLAKAGIVLPGLLASLPVYRCTRCLERATMHASGTLPPLTDSGAYPDDAFRALTLFGVETVLEECGEAEPSAEVTAYEEAHVNDEPTAWEFELDAALKLAGAFDIMSTGQQRLDDVASALVAGYAVGRSVYASDDRFQRYAGGVMPPSPGTANCDHWIYTTGYYVDATGHRVWRCPNSWSTAWGDAGEFLDCEANVLASDCLIAAAVSEVQS